jgi:hypothetical protein
MKRPVLCLGESAIRAQRIVAQLRSSGFGREVISLIYRDAADRVDMQGWLVGVGSISRPDIGAVIAAGLILAALSGPSEISLADVMRGWGVPEDGAAEVEERVSSGSTLVSVHTDNDDERRVAKQVFESNGCTDVLVPGEDPVPRNRDGNV